MRGLIVSFMAGVALLGACGSPPPQRPAPQPAQRPAGPPRLPDVLDPHVVPTSDGGAYVVGAFGRGVWYLKGATATLVHEAPPTPAR